MNILIPHTWLLEYLDTQATPQDIQKLVSLSGPSIERIYELEGESVYDIEVTTNRVDSMSVRGIAREAAVILTQAGIPSTLKIKPEPTFPIGSALPMPKIVNDPKLCKRVMCVILSDVKKVQSPDWMQKRLKQIGVNSHDAVIDVTNYITHELGHPCHAFDYDKIMALGGTIIVKEAQKGKKFAIIDGTEFETIGGEVVFENQDGEIIDLPAIKGTKNTSIADDTKNVLFWIEDIDPGKVRFASMSHAIRTVAAQLSEKGVDPNLGKDVIIYGTKLLTELTGGKVASEVFDDFPGKTQPVTVTINLSEITRYLGISPEKSLVISILEKLDCIVSSDGDTLHVTPPTFRPDITIPADVVEEIARIYGYHNLPSTFMTGTIPTLKTDDRFDIEHAVKEFLATLGAYEVYTYSLIDETQVREEEAILHTQKDPGLRQDDENKSHIKLKNPLTDDMTHMRRTLWSQHLRILQNTQEPKELTVFELANVYIPEKDATESNRKRRSTSLSKDLKSTVLPYEEFHLTVTARGTVLLETERYIKGMIEGLARKYYMPALRYVTENKSAQTSILAGDTLIGHVLFITTPQAVVIDIDWHAFLSLVRAYPMVQSESKFTPITEDLTFTIPETEQIGRVIETIAATDTQIVEVTLKDMYKRNITFSLTYTGDRQLTAEDATRIRTKIIETVKSAHQGELVGKKE